MFYYFWTNFYFFEVKAIKTTGIVIENVVNGDKFSTKNFRTKYSYLDENGTEHTKLSIYSSSFKEYEVGTEITVYYSKDNAEKSIYESKTGKILFIIFFITGAVFMVIGVVLYLTHKDEQIIWEYYSLFGKKRKTNKDDDYE